MMAQVQKPIIGMVVPALDQGGGVPAVASFILKAIKRDGRFGVRLISLPMAARDPSSVRLANPGSWLGGITTRAGMFEGEPFVEVGAFGAELECMRYQPRSPLTEAIRGCALVQVVAGSPACVNAVATCGKPIALQVATLVDVERRWQIANGGPCCGAWRRAMTAVVSRLDRAGLQACDVVLVENRWMHSHVERLSTSSTPRVRHAPPGVDTSLFRPARPDDARSGSQPYILGVGRLADPRKRLDVLLTAYERLPDAVRPALVLAGSDLPVARVRNWASERGLEHKIRILVNPSKSDLAEVYRHAACFVLPSDEEGFGMVVIEAMASGIPVIATRCGGPDDIIDSGRDGMLVDREDPSAMARVIEQVLRDPVLAHSLGTAARQTVEQRYSEPMAARPFIETYDEMLGVTSARAA